jgi:hypothetical protein
MGDMIRSWNTFVTRKGDGTKKEGREKDLRAEKWETADESGE